MFCSLVLLTSRLYSLFCRSMTYLFPALKIYAILSSTLVDQGCCVPCSVYLWCCVPSYVDIWYCVPCSVDLWCCVPCSVDLWCCVPCSVGLWCQVPCSEDQWCCVPCSVDLWCCFPVLWIYDNVFPVLWIYDVRSLFCGSIMLCSLLCGSIMLCSLFCGLLYYVPSPTDLDAVLPALFIFDVVFLSSVELWCSVPCSVDLFYMLCSLSYRSRSCVACSVDL